MDAGPEAVHSGDVKPYEGSGQKKEPFRKDPLLFMQEWLVIRKKGQDFLQTMMGEIRRGRRIVGAEGDGLGRLDDEEQKVKNDSKGDDFVETSKEGEGEYWIEFLNGQMVIMMKLVKLIMNGQKMKSCRVSSGCMLKCCVHTHRS